jgi:hypothetical protein
VITWGLVSGSEMEDRLVKYYNPVMKNLDFENIGFFP